MLLMTEASSPGNSHERHDCDRFRECVRLVLVHDPVGHAAGVLREGHLT